MSNYTVHAVTQEWNQNILRNVKAEFPGAFTSMSDANILDEFDTWNMSDKSETFAEWCNPKD